MTESEAHEACARLAREHPDRRTHRFRPRRESDGSWSVVKIALPPTPETTPETRADERPPTADDPRVAVVQNIGTNAGLPI